jgi:hypothetical protein
LPLFTTLTGLKPSLLKTLMPSAKMGASTVILPLFTTLIGLLPSLVNA